MKHMNTDVELIQWEDEEREDVQKLEVSGFSNPPVILQFTVPGFLSQLIKRKMFLFDKQAGASSNCIQKNLNNLGFESYLTSLPCVCGDYVLQLPVVQYFQIITVSLSACPPGLLHLSIV